MDYEGGLVLGIGNLAFLKGRIPYGGEVSGAKFIAFSFGVFSLLFLSGVGESLFDGRYGQSVVWVVLLLFAAGATGHFVDDIGAKRRLYESGILQEGRITSVGDIAYGDEDGFQLIVTFGEGLSTKVIVKKSRF